MDIEAILIAWFMAHPFVRAEILASLGAVAALAKKDWDAFKAYQVGEPHATFSWRVAGWQYLQGVIIGALPPVVAKVWFILGAA